MSSKGIHHTSNIKFSDFMQLSNQHPQIKICEASHLCIISELVAYKLIFFVKTNRYLCHYNCKKCEFWNMKFKWKNEFNIYKLMLKMINSEQKRAA